jgi:putative thiamine transport system permease protein
LLRAFPALTALVFAGPVAAGLLGTLLPAFGYLPALGGHTLHLGPWRDLLAAPGLGTAVRTSLTTGITSTALALAVTVLAFAAGHGTRALTRARLLLAPLLAVPHAAIAVGLAFLIAPSGWLVRLVSPWPSGWQLPPDVATIQDPAGLALVLGLVVKETPFLVLVTFAALGQVRAAPQLAAARALGYGPVRAWLLVVLPQVYPLVRLPLYAVLVYGLSVVDMALVLGPTLPPTLAPLLLRWFQSPDLDLRFQAAAGATLQLVLVLAVLALWRLGEAGIARALRPLASSGWRGGDGRAARLAAAPGLAAVLTLAVLALVVLALWSVASRWRFPDALPAGWTLGTWGRLAADAAMPFATTLALGAAAALIALVLVVGCLEDEERRGRRAGAVFLWLVYLPLLVPQIAFLFGVQVLLAALRLDGTAAALVLAHLLFVLPYTFLVLADPYRALDPRYARAARSLGKGRARVLLAVKLPLLLRPLLLAAAIGFAVSVAQFLPTLLAGAGRFRTLTTEALALAAGGDRRVTGGVAFTLALLPLAAFALALAVPAWRFRHRGALRTGG